MEKRFQVFVSSTYTDLQEERRAVMQKLLQIDCIPAGMELFPSADSSAWNVIRPVIEQSDYYLLILGGRYGSASKDNPLSFTEREYNLAVESNIPVLPFFHADPAIIPAGKTDLDEPNRRALAAFKDRVKAAHHIKTYLSPSELVAEAIIAITSAKVTQPRTGWVRASEAADPRTLKDLERVRRENDDLKARIALLQGGALEDTEDLAFGDELIPGRFSYRVYSTRRDEISGRRSDEPFDTVHSNFPLSWRQMFQIVGPRCLVGVAERYIESFLQPAMLTAAGGELKRKTGVVENAFLGVQVLSVIKTQLMALGLMEYYESSGNTPLVMWRLTSAGRRRLMIMMAVRKMPNGEVPAPSPSNDATE